MSDEKNIVWTTELRSAVVSLWQEGKGATSIAAELGVPLGRLKNAIQRGKTGAWGKEHQQILNKQHRSKISKVNAEARERGITYGQLQAEKLKAQMTHIPQHDPPAPDEEPVIVPGQIVDPLDIIEPDTAQPIDMIAAVDILTACANQFGMDELIETRGSKSHDKAAITFAHGDETYVLEIFGTYE